MDSIQLSESDGLPQTEKVWELDVNELVIEPKPFARGAFSQVYKGEYFGTKICVKLLKSDDADLLKFTCREVSSLKFSHPNIVQFIGAAERRDEVLIAMEYVAGGNLRHYLKDHTVSLPWDLRIRIAIDIASGMAFLHSKNVIHRDLKSKNLLVGDNWRIKVCDFGFARSLNGNRRQLMTMCGTNEWMAPEILLGEPYDEKADVFSFGIVLVELMTRTKVGEDIRRGPETQYRVDEDLLRGVVPRDAPPSLVDLTMRCCTYDSRERPSFKEITKDLKSILKKKEVRAMSPPSSPNHTCPPSTSPPVLSPIGSPFTSPIGSPRAKVKLPPKYHSNSATQQSILPQYSNGNNTTTNNAINNNNIINNGSINNGAPLSTSALYNSGTDNYYPNNPYNNHTHNGNGNGTTGDDNTLSLSSLDAALPAASSPSLRKEKAATAPPCHTTLISNPTGTWSTSWDPIPSTQSNPLYRPRPFAEGVLTDSHPLRSDHNGRSDFYSNPLESGYGGSRKRDFVRK